jgi:hypothetical protein
MGAWGEGIMENDSALDAELKIREVIFRCNSDIRSSKKHITAKRLEDNIEEIYRRLRVLGKMVRGDKLIFSCHEDYHALGYHILRTGASVEPKVIDDIILASTVPNHEGWFDVKARRKVMAKFKAKLIAYKEY